jgi:hypothetical protein
VNGRRRLMVAAPIVVALALGGCRGIGQPYVPLPVGTCVRVSDDGSTATVPCAEPHTHRVIAVVGDGEECPPESNMAAQPADPDDGLITECFGPDAAGE